MSPCSSDYLFTLRCRGLVAGLLFPHPLVVTPSTSLTLAGYMRGLARYCLIAEGSTVSPGLVAKKFTTVLQFLKARNRNGHCGLTNRVFGSRKHLAWRDIKRLIFLLATPALYPMSSVCHHTDWTISSLSGRALVGGLFFRHHLVSTPSVALGFSAYIYGLARY
jgi:hypothetical protein